MSSPIYTKVVNNSRIDKVFYWAGTDTVVVPANGETTVPFDIWSKADAGQRESIKAAVSDGSVSLTIGVRTEGGDYTEVDFMPCDRDTQISVTAEPIPVSHTETVNEMRVLAEENDHVVIAKSDTTSANKDFYSVKSEAIESVETLGVEGASTEGFKSEQVKEPVSEPDKDVAEDTAAEDKTAEVEQQFAELVSKKEWAKALELLKSVFGSKVTFGTRAIMSVKDYKAIVAKYKLA